MADFWNDLNNRLKKIKANIGPPSIPGICSSCKNTGVMTNWSRSHTPETPMCRNCTHEHPKYKQQEADSAPAWNAGKYDNDFFG